MSGKVCRVSFKDLEGVRHSVEVTADSVYEAAALALSSLTRSTFVENIGPGTKLDIQIIEPGVTHMLLVAQMRQWLERPPTSPAESSKKQKLKALLAS